MGGWRQRNIYSSHSRQKQIYFSDEQATSSPQLSVQTKLQASKRKQRTFGPLSDKRSHELAVTRIDRRPITFLRPLKFDTREQWDFRFNSLSVAFYPVMQNSLSEKELSACHRARSSLGSRESSPKFENSDLDRRRVSDGLWKG